jgi:D-glycero-alpha-D-manno-heptose-7-phosphate kinase
MIITRTPLRISFLGGGTDYPAHYLKNGGQTLGAAMNRYTFITVKRLPDLFDYKIRAAYSKIELCPDLDSVDHPSVRECMRFMGVESGLEISVVSDLPARSGVGSSSSFTVGFLNALHGHKGETVSKLRLASEAVHVEHDLIKERVGVQDQYTCANGGIVHIRCGTDGTVRLDPVPVHPERRRLLEERLVMFYTGIQRTAHHVLPEQMKKTASGENHSHLSKLNDLVPAGIEVLCGERPLAEFGELLHTGWMTKRSLSSQVSTSDIDAYYNAALDAGAVGGKLMGAGSGGFLLLYVEPDRLDEVARALDGLPMVRASFDYTGSSVIFYDPDVSEPGKRPAFPAAAAN